MLEYFKKYPIQTGIVFGIATAYLFLSILNSQTLVIVLLAMIAGVYFGFAINDGRPRVILVESIVCFVFVFYTTGLLDKNMFPIWFLGFSTRTMLALGFVAHGVWDYMHHMKRSSPIRIDTNVAPWYPVCCAWYDWSAAVVIYLL